MISRNKLYLKKEMEYNFFRENEFVNFWSWENSKNWIPVSETEVEFTDYIHFFTVKSISRKIYKNILKKKNLFTFGHGTKPRIGFHYHKLGMHTTGLN